MNPSRTDASTRNTALAGQIRAEADRRGFEAVGFARAEAHPHLDRLREWIAAGRHGGMRWMAREPDRRADPRALVAGARTVISVAASYYRGGWEGRAPAAGADAGARADPAADPGALHGRIARYAWSRDYHRRLLRRLRAFGRAVSSLVPGHRWTACLDARPALDRAWAERAGLGWIGKNTNVILGRGGSWFFLGAIVTTLDLPADPPARNHCGRCTACIPACPTGAIVGPYQLDARRCISYLTIEHRGTIPPDLRPLVGTRVFGCDDCQEVCPWNRHAVPTAHPDFAERPEQQTPELIPLLALDGAAFHARFQGTAILRARRDGFVRNVAVALGNLRDPRAVPALAQALHADASPLVRAHAAWALGRIADPRAREALGRAASSEPNADVHGEISRALVPLPAVDGSGPPGYPLGEHR